MDLKRRRFAQSCSLAQHRGSATVAPAVLRGPPLLSSALPPAFKRPLKRIRVQWRPRERLNRLGFCLLFSLFLSPQQQQQQQRWISLHGSTRDSGGESLTLSPATRGNVPQPPPPPPCFRQLRAELQRRSLIKNATVAGHASKHAPLYLSRFGQTYAAR